MFKRSLPIAVISFATLVSFTAGADCSDDVLAAKVKEALGFNQTYSDIYVESQKKAINIGDSSVRIVLNGNNSYIFNGERSEIDFNTSYEVGDTVEYDFAFNLMDSSGYYQAWDGEWVIIAQWHDQPNPNNGETWATFAKNSPPLSYQLKYDDGLKLVIKSVNQEHEFDVSPGSEIECKNKIHWLYDSEGSVSGSCTIDGTEHDFSFTDQIMLNDYFHYFKMGMYRDKAIDANMGIELKSLTITNVTDNDE
ncbi:polysaccharide lyase [Vibrio sp.]|nr:polysaccharide lyase [Vibrio sp.]